MSKLFKSLFLTISIFISSNLMKAQIVGPTTICQSTLSSYFCNQTSFAYAWTVSPSSGVGISDTTLDNVAIFFPADGNYTVTVITSFPTDTINIAVAVYTILPSPIVSNAIFCGNDTVTALAASAQSGGYLDWYADDLGTIFILPPTPTSDTTYYVKETLDGCQSLLTPVTATFYASPIVTIASNSPICEGQTIDLNSSGGLQYTWAGPASFVSSLQNPSISNSTLAMAGTYSVSATDVNGCTVTSTTDVTITPGQNISGTVFLNGSPITAGQVYLFTPIQGTTIYDTIAIANLNANGQYTYTSVSAGDYIIKCIPDYITYPTLIGTYYGDVSLWNLADTIHQDCSSNSVANINVIEELVLTGPGTISGTIIEGIGFGNRLINSINEVQVPGGPLKNISVNLVSLPSNTIVAQTISDSVGYYEFINVAIGNYTLQVDILGLPMDSSYLIIIDPFRLSSNHNQIATTVYSNLDFYADNTAIYIANSIGISQNSTKENLISIYPNPAKNSINIKVQSSDKINEQIEIIDNLGKTVAAQNLNSELTQVNIETLNSGFYFVKVKSDKGINTFRFIKQ
jgi:hypothetical protein